MLRAPMRFFAALLVALFTMTGCDCGRAKVVEVFDAGCRPEVCDGLDDDCNGLVDDGLPSLSCGVGGCTREVPSCLDGSAQACEPGTPAAESCNGLDDDCDGVTDEDLAPAMCGVGACFRSVTACIGGTTQTCTPGAPTAETCNSIDDDCDTQIDEGFSPLSCGVGDCARRVAACVGGTAQTCTAGAPAPEACDNRDNDCNGAIDDGLPPATCGVGECARSVVSCVGGVSQTCTPGGPSADVCDGLDNDCDNTIDDDGICQPPVVMCPGALSTVVGTTVTLTGSASDADGTIVFRQWSVSTRPVGSSAQPATPNALSTQFTPDAPGTFVLSFCARDNAGTTTCCTTTISTSACASPPAPPVSTACVTSWDGRPIVQFDPVPAGLTYQLTRAGNALVLASSSPGSNYLRPPVRITGGGPPPGLSTALEVRACRLSEPSCCSTPSPLSVDVVEDCSTAITPTSSNVVLSEYITSGEGTCPSVNCMTQDTCQAGESVEITNLSNCPISLDGNHFAYRNAAGSTSSYRWMNFGPTDIIPPRGVYVAMRSRMYAPTCSASLGAESPALYGLRSSSLAMQGLNLCSGWFNNTGGGMSEMRLAPGTIATGQTPSFAPGAAITRIAPYLPLSGSSASCTSIGFDAVDSCGSIVGGSAPTTALNPNQLGRLWHPCDAVVGAVPACIRD